MKRDPKGTYSYGGELYGPEYAKEGRSVAALDKLNPLKGKRADLEKARQEQVRLDRAVTGTVSDRGEVEEPDPEEELDQEPEEIVEGEDEETEEEIEEEPLARPTKPARKGRGRKGR